MPPIADDEVLVYVMAAGINYNNVWAGLGIPVNVIGARNKAGEPEDFHIGGSDASGIVYRRQGCHQRQGRRRGGDPLRQWDRNCAWVKSGGDPMYSPSFRIWGYETNFGSFAQFTKVQGQQCMPKPKHMTWEEAAAYTLVAATAWRMLHGWGERGQERRRGADLGWCGRSGLDGDSDRQGGGRDPGGRRFGARTSSTTA
jgi:crotonyl-CoA carboxylase/reductase